MLYAERHSILLLLNRLIDLLGWKDLRGDLVQAQDTPQRTDREVFKVFVRILTSLRYYEQH